jgi:microcystin-dependent protein
MALDFPTSPTIGDTFDDWVWDGTAWQFAQTLPGGLPAGSIIPWGGSSAPANWLLCDGTAVSRTTYASLFSAIGTAYGTGDGSTTFNLPDLRGRVPVGRNSGSFGTLGATGGVESVTLTVDQMPSHTHTQNSHTHSGTTNSSGAHTHVLARGGTNAQVLTQTAAGDGGVANRWHLADGSSGGVGIAGTTSSGAHTHTFTTGGTVATNQNTGGGQSHTNVQPYQVVNYIIKATAASTPGDSELATRVQPVTLGGTGTTSLTAGNYLKGNGTNAVVTQTGVPATDLTGTINTARLPNIPVDIGGSGATTGAGLTPIVPSSVVVGSGSSSSTSTGFVTFTGVNTLSLNGVFSSAFKSYRIVLNIAGMSAGSDFRFRLRSAGTDNAGATNYYIAGRISAANSTSSEYAVNGTTAGYVGYIYPASADYFSTTMDFHNPFLARLTTHQNAHTGLTSTGIAAFSAIGGLHNLAASYDGITFFPSAAATFSGTVQLYGYR